METTIQTNLVGRTVILLRRYGEGFGGGVKASISAVWSEGASCYVVLVNGQGKMVEASIRDVELQRFWG